MVYQFGPFELDLSTAELRVDGKARALEPQVFALLSLLVEFRERVVSKAARARVSTPNNLDAWSVYHLALQHMYRFNRGDNAAATRLFEHAVKLDPCFARAH